VEVLCCALSVPHSYSTTHNFYSDVCVPTVAFNLFDLDGNGFLSLSDLTSILQARTHHPLNVRECRHIELKSSARKVRFWEGKNLLGAATRLTLNVIKAGNSSSVGIVPPVIALGGDDSWE